jgi:hypothetical protein
MNDSRRSSLQKVLLVIVVTGPGEGTVRGGSSACLRFTSPGAGIRVFARERAATSRDQWHFIHANNLVVMAKCIDPR